MISLSYGHMMIRSYDHIIIKHDQIDEKPIFRSKKLPKKKIGAKKSNVANCLKRVLTNFDDSPGLVRRVNGP